MSDTESVCFNPDQFKIAVKEWVLINDQLEEKRKIVAERNKRKKELSQVIISFMKDNDKEICNLGENGTLQMRKQKTQATLNKDHLNKWITVKANVKKHFKELHDLDVKELSGVAIMTDTDNSKLKAIAYYQNIYFSSE